MSLIPVAVALFFTINAIGNVPVFLALLRHFDRRHQRVIIIRELLIALAIILAFSFWGEYILKAIGVSESIVSVGGGVILFLIAINMIFPKPVAGDHNHTEPFIVPLATPLLAGPGTIAAAMLYRHQMESDMHIFLAIILAWGGSAIILILAPQLERLLGSKGLAAVERLMGMVLILIAAQMFITGIANFTQVYYNISL